MAGCLFLVPKGTQPVFHKFDGEFIGDWGIFWLIFSDSDFGKISLTHAYFSTPHFGWLAKPHPNIPWWFFRRSSKLPKKNHPRGAPPPKCISPQIFFPGNPKLVAGGYYWGVSQSISPGPMPCFEFVVFARCMFFFAWLVFFITMFLVIFLFCVFCLNFGVERSLFKW